MAAVGRDATIFWNYVDLRFRTPSDCQLEVWLTKSELRLRLRVLEAVDAPQCLPPAPAPSITPHPEHPAESCETCGVISCFRNPSATGLTQNPATAWLVDAWWPVHGAWMAAHRRPGDTLLTPLDRRRWRTGPYHWNSAGFVIPRKGARELRGALHGLHVPVTLAGPPLEGAGFWNGADTRPAGVDWLADAAAVVLPSWVENQPRRLLAALAAGVPVICTPACGLGERPGFTLVPEGDTAALREAVKQCLAIPQPNVRIGANLVAMP